MFLSSNELFGIKHSKSRFYSKFKEGTVLKTRISEIHEANRATMGVKVIRLKEGESISEVLIEPSEEDLEAKDDPSLDKEAKDEALENLLNKETLEEEENE